MVASHGRLVDLGHVASRSLQVQKLLVQCGGRIHRQGLFVAVGLVIGAVDHGQWAWDGHFDWPGGVGLGETQVLHHRLGPALYPTHHPRHQPFGGGTPADGFWTETDGIQALPASQNMVYEVGPSLLTVRKQVQAQVLLFVEGDQGGVILGLAQVLLLDSEGHVAAIPLGQPAWARKAADGGCGYRRQMQSFLL